MHSGRVEPSVHSVAVELQFVKPVGAVWCALNEFGKLRLDPGRWRSRSSHSAYLRHWSHDLAFAKNSSYQGHWLTDFPDTYLREAVQNRYHRARRNGWRNPAYSSFRLISPTPQHRRDSRVSELVRTPRRDRFISKHQAGKITKQINGRVFFSDHPARLCGQYHSSAAVNASARRWATSRSLATRAATRSVRPCICATAITLIAAITWRAGSPSLVSSPSPASEG